MFSEFKQYVDLRIEEAKLKVSDEIAGILSLIITIFVATIISITVFALIAFAVMGWLNRPDMLGQPWGTVISIGFLLLILLAAIIVGKRVFPKVIRRALVKRIGTVTNDVRDDIQAVMSDVRSTEDRLMSSPAVVNVQNLTSGIALTVAAVRKIIKMFK